MTQNEADEICKKMSDANLAIWKSRTLGERDSALADFRSLSSSLVENGYKISRKKVFDGCQVVPTFKAKPDHHCYEHVDVRPPGNTLQRDCTTRCLTFCLNEDYDNLKKEQLYRASKEQGSKDFWNHECVWGKIFKTRGYVRLDMPRKMARFNVAKLTTDFNFPMATHSSGHVAAMIRGKVIDTWNSEGGRVDYVYVPEESKEAVKLRLGAVEA